MPKVLVVAVCAVLVACGGSSVAQSQSAQTCAAIAVEYRAALDQAIVCDPSAANACVPHGALVVTEGTGNDAGQQTITGLCTNCPAAVNPSSTAQLDAILSRYTAVGCSGTCPCPSGRLSSTWSPQCTATGNGTGTCD